jgi:prepilin-type N-terminal cleavage/methylation domain-containing protein
MRVTNRGFTLLEVIAVLAVTAALVAALAPLAFRYLDDAKKTQAQNDANQIAQAIGQFFKDTGRPPYKNNIATLKIQAKESGDFDCLYGSSGNEWTTATDATGSASWTSAGGVQCQAGSATRDTIENQLILNTPGGSTCPGVGCKAYTTSGISAWNGPYLPSVPADPWGNKYLVNVGKADPNAGKAVWVISGGPNGSLETSANAAANGTLTPVGDDIVARVK